jgi:hypothetical protein
LIFLRGYQIILPSTHPALSVVLRFRLRFTSAFVRLRLDKAAFASVPAATGKNHFTARLRRTRLSTR